MTEWDNTSLLCGQGKVKLLKIALGRNENVSSYINAFALTSRTHDDVATADEQFLLEMYKAETFAMLNECRHMAYPKLNG